MLEVSVVVPVHNGETYLKECLDSILAQTHKELELIVVDDGSSDGSAEIVKGLKDDRIKYFNKTQGGTVEARKYGLSQASKDYVAFCDQDDKWLPEKLKKQLSQINDFDLVHSDAYLLKQGRRDGTFWKSISSVPAKGGRELLPQFLYRNQINNPSVLFKRKWAPFAMNLCSNSKVCLDLDYSFWLEILYQGARFNYISEPLVEYRVNESQQTASRYRSRLWQSFVIREFLIAHPDVWRTYPGAAAFKFLKTEAGLAVSRFFNVLSPEKQN